MFCKFCFAEKCPSLPPEPFDAFFYCMSQPYEEILDGASLPRSAPGERHEIICERLHREMAVGVAGLATTQLLAPRTKIQISRTTALCPDLALVTAATGKLFLAVEIVSRDDHNADTFVTKEVYEKIRVPRPREIGGAGVVVGDAAKRDIAGRRHGFTPA